MQHRRIVTFVHALFARAIFAAVGAFTEPPIDSFDYARTYELGQTVFVTWNQSWPLVHLRLDPISAANVFEYGVTYATLISNATNTGTFEWKIGQNDNVTLDLVQNNPRMFFQLNDATGGDSFTLDSRAFLVLGSNPNVTSTGIVSPSTPSVHSTSEISSTAAHTNIIPAPHGFSQAGKVGVGIGVPFAVICLSVIGFLIFKLRKRKDNKGESGGMERRPELEHVTFRAHEAPVMVSGSYEQRHLEELPEK